MENKGFDDCGVGRQLIKRRDVIKAKRKLLVEKEKLYIFLFVPDFAFSVPNFDRDTACLRRISRRIAFFQLEELVL